MFYLQAPAGNRISLDKYRNHDVLIKNIFTPYKIIFYDSGTSSLAIAVMLANKKKQIEKPEVLIPAYSCPDLVSAVIYANATPVMVDLEKERPWLDINDLESKITANTIAIIAVDLFGIPERSELLIKISKEVNITLIQDSAQSFPLGVQADAWYGDIIVLSFGRGKPVSILYGGGLLYKDNIWEKYISELETSIDIKYFFNTRYICKIKLYNLLVNPYLYWLIEKISFLEIGETRYKELETINRISIDELAHLIPNIHKYRDLSYQIQAGYSRLIDSIHNNLLINLPKECGVRKTVRLNRYPVLVTEKIIRDKLLKALKKNGIGASTMYPGPLDRIKGLESFRFSNDCKKANEFSNKIITLPLHDRITMSDVIKTGYIFKTVLENIPHYHN